MKNEAFVIGGSSGIGFNIAKRLSKKNYNISIASSNFTKLIKAKKNIEKNSNAKVSIFKVNLLNDNEIKIFLKKLGNSKKNYTFIMYCVGKAFYGDFIKSSDKNNEEIIKLNINSYVKIIYFFIKHMKRHGKLSYIVSLGSLAGYVPNPKLLLYGTTKKFIEFFSLVLRENLKNTNINVSLVTPGQTDTDFLKKTKFKNLNSYSMNPKDVSMESINKIFNKKKIIVPGFLNKLRFYAYKLLPLWLIYFIYNKKI